VDGRSLKVRHLSALFAAIISCSSLMIFVHHHNNVEVYPDCAACKFAADLSSADGVSPDLPIRPYPMVAPLETDSVVRMMRIATVGIVSRAPPLAVFPGEAYKHIV